MPVEVSPRLYELMVCVVLTVILCILNFLSGHVSIDFLFLNAQT